MATMSAIVSLVVLRDFQKLIDKLFVILIFNPGCSQFYTDLRRCQVFWLYLFQCFHIVYKQGIVLRIDPGSTELLTHIAA